MKFFMFLLYPIVMLTHPQLRGYSIHKLTQLYKSGESFFLPAAIAIIAYPLLLLSIYLLTLTLWVGTQQVGAVIEDAKHSVNTSNLVPIEERPHFDNTVVDEEEHTVITDEEYKEHKDSRTEDPKVDKNDSLDEIQRMIDEAKKR